jgi:acetyltransferase
MFSGSYSHTDPSQNFIERYPQPLDALFHARTVAVIGAKDDPGTVGRTIMINLLAGSFQGKIYPINPKRDQVLGIKTYPTITSVPEEVDLAIIVTPAPTVPKIVAECVEAHVKTAIIISAGFKELGEAGQRLEEEILLYARKGKMPIIGPNCLGVMNPVYGLNATFAKGMALPGNLAFISQSGAMCTAVLDWSLQEKVGFSVFVSIGSMADVNWGTLIDYLGSDPHTHSLLLYMETVGDARSFMTAAREVALEKPIIIIKAGRSQAAAKAAASHTGSLAGSDEVFDAALERIGVLRVNTIAELFNMASVLAKQPRPKGPNLTIVTNAGGPGVLATDAVVLNKAELTPLSEQIVEDLNQVLPSAWSHSNPVDILGDADADRYVKSIEVLVKDPIGDGLLVILSPQDMTDPTATALRIRDLAQHSGKPLLASWMGGESVKEGANILSNARIPVFLYPDDAARTFATMWSYSRNLQTLYEVPIYHPSTEEEGESVAVKGQPRHVKQIIQTVQKEGRSLLNEFESKQVLEDYHIPIVKTVIAHEPEEAADFAKQLGFPIVLKLFSQTITHKTDVGGVKLNLLTPDDVINAFHEIQKSVTEKVGKEHFEGVTVQRMIKHAGYELILGSTTDPQFGPVVLFGMGGQLVEIFKDSALAIPPLNLNLARQMMQKTKIYEALLGVRGRKPINIGKLEEILISFSQLVVENPRIKECDINPLLASEEEIIALDARIVLHEPEISDSQLPQLAIRPYPFNYILSTTLKNGIPITLRPIRPEDEPLIVQFHRELSEKSIRQRFFEFMSLDKRVARERLVRICFNDYDREWAIVAEVDQDNKKQIIGIGRLTRIPGLSQAEFKLMIMDAYHHLGLGTQLMQHFLLIANQEKIQIVNGYILSENTGMLKICENLGFTLHQEKDSSIIHAQWNAH